MRTTVDQENLARVTRQLARVATDRSLPETHNVLIEAHGNTLRLTATDRVTSLALTIDSEVIVEGVTVLPSRILNEVANAYTSDLTLSIEEPYVCITDTESSWSRVLTQNEAAFPRPVDFDGGNPVTISVLPYVLTQAVRRIIFAIDDESENPMIQAIHLVLEENEGAYLVGTDSLRFAFHKLSYVGRTDRRRIAIALPPKAVQQFCIAIRDHQETVTITVNGTGVSFVGTGITLRTQALPPIQIDFKDAMAKLLRSEMSVALITRSDLIAAMKQALLFTGNRIKRCHVTLVPGDNGCIHIVTGETQEKQPRLQQPMMLDQDSIFVADISAVITGPTRQLVCNPQFVLDAAQKLTEEHVQLGIQGGSLPAVMTIPENNEYTYVVMPMQG